MKKIALISFGIFVLCVSALLIFKKFQKLYNTYLEVSEYVVVMKTSDSEKNVTARLFKRKQKERDTSDADDMDFTWKIKKTDSDGIIDMSYTKGTCTIRPLKAGNVIIRCAHPKALHKKDVLVLVRDAY